MGTKKTHLNEMVLLTLSMLGNFYAFLSSADFFQLTISKKSFKNAIRVSNSLDPDQDRYSVSPDQGPNCLQRLSDDKSCC